MYYVIADNDFFKFTTRKEADKFAKEVGAIGIMRGELVMKKPIELNAKCPYCNDDAMEAMLDDMDQLWGTD